jgi:hypothetical protein
MIPQKMTSKDYYTVSGSIFGLVAVMHLLRVVNDWIFIFGKWHVPSWASVVAVAVAGYLSYQAFVLAGVIKPK